MQLKELNSEAGTHALPTDHREIEAAMLAGMDSWAQTPYYGYRYDDRGRRFTRSDSAYLAALSHYPDAIVERQISWLAGILANRGMPTVLLESHLRTLTQRLTEAVPERRDTYRRLEDQADRLRAMRLRTLPRAHWSSLQDAFCREQERDRKDPLYRGTAKMVIGAVVDVAHGHRHARRSLVDWLSSGFFPQRWGRGIRKLAAAASDTVESNGASGGRGLDIPITLI